MPQDNRRARPVYAIVPRSDGRDHWMRVGSAFANRDGSETILLDAVPLGGKLQVRSYELRDAAPTKHEAEAV